jgi:ferrous iron transport protein B
MAQVAMLIALAGPYGPSALALIFGTLAVLWLVLGRVLKRSIKGASTEILLDVPPYRLPYLRGIVQKVWMRIFAFMKEAIPFVLVGVLMVNVLYHFSFIEAAGRAMSPVIVSLFGLPKESIGALVVGFLRKDVAVGMLVPLQLTFKQTVVAGVVLAVYFPCMATFVVILRELGIIDTLKAVLIMLVTVLAVGGSLNLLLTLFGM